MALLWVALLGGCDIQADVRLTGTPIGGPASGSIDENANENVIAYFYAGKPVSGLLYSCSRSNIIEYSGQTDINGRFVCPRDTTVSFFLGVSGVKTLRLGQVELSIYGQTESPARRNNVVISPDTLYGSSVSGSKREVQNIFNLLYSLDTLYFGSGRLQEIIDLESNVLAAAVDKVTFADLVAMRIDALPSVFDNKLRELVNSLASSHNLRLASTAPEPTLGVIGAVDKANEALLRARAGLYRSNSTMIDAIASSVFLGTSEFMVGADGVASGVAYTEEYSSATTSTFYQLSILNLGSSARMLEDGTLQDFIFGGGSTRQLDLFGTMINSAVWGESRLCQPDSPNEFIPQFYCAALEANGGFSIRDVGVFESLLGYSGELYIGQPQVARPDIDLDELPVNYLPRTFELTLSRYTDIQFGDLSNADHDSVNEDKAVFGPLEVLPGKVRYTLLPNGDIVSDVDNDCAPLSVFGGRYQDEDGSPEYLMGRIGSVFTVEVGNSTVETTDDTRHYLDIYLNVLDSAHPDFGFTMGAPAVYRGGLHAAVLEYMPGTSLEPPAATLRSKSCDPTATTVCNDKVEWFNNIRYARDVMGVDRSTPSELTPSDVLNYRVVPYYGQVSGLTEVKTPVTTICRP